MDKLSPKKKLAIVRLYLSGLSYDEIAAKSGASKGTVANVTAELKAGAFPEAADAAEQIELLRELSLDLKHLGFTPGQCAVGLAVLNRIKECGLEAADIERWPGILKAAGSPGGAKGFVELVYRIQESQKRSGLTLEQADEKLHEVEAKAAQLEPALKQLEKCRQEIKELTTQRGNLTPLVSSLEQKYGLLDPRVRDLEKREKELLQRIKQEEARTEATEVALAELSKEKQSLQKAGFSLEALAEFNDRARAIATHHHITVAALRDRLFHELESLDKGLELEALTGSKEEVLKKCQQEIAAARKERESLKEAIAVLGVQKAALETAIKATREKVSGEIAKIIPVARETISQLAKELQLGNKAVLDDVQHLKDRALEVGKEIGRYEGIVQVNQWLLELLSLAQGKDALEAERVRSILLLVLRSGHSWMKRNQAKIGFSNLSYTTGLLIEELEQWRI